MNMLLTTKAPPSTTSEPARSTCTHSKLYHHVTLVGGLRAGNFTRLAEFTDMADCARRCCDVRTCDVAILMGDTCFALECSAAELCSVRPARLKNFSLKMIYMYRKVFKGMLNRNIFFMLLVLTIVKYDYLSIYLFKWAMSHGFTLL